MFSADILVGTSKVWDVTPNHILVGHVQEVADATSLEDCALACLNAEKTYSFTCQSAMWYPSDPDQNCLLNSETKVTQPDVFVPEDQGVNMLYFDIGLEAPKQEKSEQPLRVRFARNLALNKLQVNDKITFQDDPLVDDKWTKWSKCELSKSGFRKRYLKCKEKDVRKCPKETVKCECKLHLLCTFFEGGSMISYTQIICIFIHLAVSISVVHVSVPFPQQHQPLHPLGTCLAVRDQNNVMRCPHGMRTLPNGEREYCRRPIDCPTLS